MVATAGRLGPLGPASSGLRGLILAGWAWACLSCHPSPRVEPRAVESVSAPSLSPPVTHPHPVAETRPPANRPVLTPLSQLAHARAWETVVREPGVPALRPTGDMPGAFTPILEPPGSSSLAGFHSALHALAEGKRQRVRIAMYGASGTASDLATGYLREYVQTRFGVGGPGFAPLVPLSRWYAHQHVEVRASDGWHKQHAQVHRGVRDGRYGYLGASFATARAGQWAEVRTRPEAAGGDRVTTLELHVLAQRGGGRFRVEIDGRDRGTFSTAAEEPTADFHVFPVDPGAHALRLTTLGGGEVRVFGVVAETDRPGVVVDTLGIDGTRATNHVEWDEQIWTESVVHRGIDLVTFSYGTNEASDEDDEMTLDQYRDHLSTVLTRLRRALPEVGCLLLGPGDYPIVVDGRARPRPRLLAIVEIQRELAPSFGCGFWDGLAFMGGAGSMREFVEYDPPLARGDYLHFNRRGSARKAQAQVDALMWALDAQLGLAGS